MPIHLHRSNRTEVLVQMLCRVLGDNLPSDPFQQYPVVVGSRGMERWLRHEIATQLDIAVGQVFPFPRQAFAGAARWVLSGAEDRDKAFWEADPESKEQAQQWERDALSFRLVGLLRGHAGEPEFATVTRYLAEGRDDTADGSVSARELLFCAEVGDVVDRLMRDRPDDALVWAGDPGDAPPEHRWLAMLLRDIGAATDPHSPAVLDRALLAAKPHPTQRSICIFGLSTMGPGDRRQLAAIARWMDVHLFLLVPTNHWFQHQRTPLEARAARRDAVCDDDREQLEAELASDNPILTSLGAPSRDLQVWLEQVEYEGDLIEAIDPASGPEPTVLQRLQSWILAGQGPDVDDAPWPLDASLTAHSTYGALRQCEVLRDELLSLFAADPSLEPRDVLVMTPDIETFAPLVAAVFARTGQASGQSPGESVGELPRIPVAIADLGLRRTNPVAEVLLKTLEVAGDRLSASWILDFIALEPVRRKWNLDDDDMADMGLLVRESGLRWGVDAADRGRVGQPARDQNTARFALERLALGVLMPDESTLDVVPALSGDLEPAVPYEVQSRKRVTRIGQLSGIVRTLCAHRDILRESATVATWRDRLVAALDDLAATSDKSGWLRAEVDQALEDMARGGALLGDRIVERAAILRWLEGDFEIPQRGDRVITGAVQVCALEPMRSVPFRVVALLGMDDKAFPRGGRARTWDPMEQRVRGERDRREVDRHLMLEAILSARDRLLLLWSGHDVQQGKEQPAAVPVEELLETLAGLTGQSRKQLVREHPLQPWSAANFGPDSASFDYGMAHAARVLRQIERGEMEATTLGLAASGTEGLPSEIRVPTTLDLTDLANALLDPHKLLLRDRLGLSVDQDEPVTEDREPLELETLDTWNLRNQMLEHLGAETDAWTEEQLVGAMEARLAGEGTLPSRAGGRVILGAQAVLAQQVLTHSVEVAGDVAEGLELSVRLDDQQLLVGRVAHVLARDGQLLLQWTTPSKAANERSQLLAWLHLLAAVASGHPVVGARLVGYGSESNSKRAGGDFLGFGGDAAEARRILTDLVGIWRVARDRPLPLFKKTSSAVGGVLANADGAVDTAKARIQLSAAVAVAWHGGSRTQGDIDDAWIRTFFVDYDPVDHLEDLSDEADPLGLIGLARRVWIPLVRGLNLGKDLGPEWIREVTE